jgi:hypothetical protein
VLAVPVFERWTDPAAVALSETLVTVTFAVLELDPNIPNTYPRMAAAAMSVAAMMRTVATIGEIAFLCCPGIFINLLSSVR